MTDREIQRPENVSMNGKDGAGRRWKAPISDVEREWKRQDRYFYWGLGAVAVVLIVLRFVLTAFYERSMRRY
jgi:hypothetical protein